VVDADDHLVGIVTEADLLPNRFLPDPRALIHDETSEIQALLLSRLPQQTTRALAVELTARGGDFPLAQVYRVFTRHGVTIEIREISQGDTASAKYLATCPSGTSLEALNADLLNAPVGLRAIAWEPARKKVL